MNVISLRDEKGNKFSYELLDIIKYGEKIYGVFYPKEEGDTEILILRIEESENPEESVYVVEQDEQIIGKVFNEFKEKYKDEINFTL